MYPSIAFHQWSETVHRRFEHPVRPYDVTLLNFDLSAQDEDVNYKVRERYFHQVWFLRASVLDFGPQVD